MEMLETELIAMKLCKLKMEADKTEAELQVKQMEKTLHALQTGRSSQVHAHSLHVATCLRLCCAHVWTLIRVVTCEAGTLTLSALMTCAGAGGAGGLGAGFKGSE